MGIGIGMIISTLILFLSGTNKMSNAEIEKAARAMGMHYEDECKVFFENDNYSSNDATTNSTTEANEEDIFND